MLLGTDLHKDDTQGEDLMCLPDAVYHKELFAEHFGCFHGA